MKGLRASINAFCRSCIYDPIGGTGNWRQQVTACTSPSCPLFDVRPRSKGIGAEICDDAQTAPNRGLLGTALAPHAR